MCVDLGQLRLTAWMLKVGSGQVRYLKVVHGWRRTLGGAPPVPLVQSVPGLGAQHPGCLLLLKVLDEGHSSISTGQIIPTCRITETAVAVCGEKGLITTAMGVSLFTGTSVAPPAAKMIVQHLRHMIKHSNLHWRHETEPTLSLQQRWIQQLHHVLNLRIQLRNVTLSHDVRQHGQEVIGTIHPAWKEVRQETQVGVTLKSDRSSRGWDQCCRTC